MNTRAFTLALVIAFVAMFMVYTYIEDQKSSLILKYGTPNTVVVAKQDISELELIDDSKVIVKSIPENFVAPGVFRDMKEVENTVATVPILKGEQITKPRVTYPGMKTGLSRQVSIGKRALSIPISDNSAVSKLIKPGDRVDIIIGIDYGGGRLDKQMSETVLQDVLVLSTGIAMTNSIPLIGVKTSREIKAMNLNTFNKYDSVTLELDPYQAQKLIYALSWTQKAPYLSLRNNSDKNIVRIKPTNLYDILGDNAADARQFIEAKYDNKSSGKRGR